MPISNYKELIQTLNWDDEKRTQERWYIFLLMNPRYQTNAGIDIIQNFSYLNLRSKNVTLFLPGLSNLDEGVVPYRSNHGHKIVYEDDSFGAIYFDERGFLETIDWLEKGSGNVYKYSEDLDLVIVKYYPRYIKAFANEAYEQNFDLNNMIVYNLDELKQNGKNVIKFIMDCRDVVSDSKSESEIKQRLNGLSRNSMPIPQGIVNTGEYDVFISYSRKDYLDDAGNVLKNNVLSKIKETLKSNGRSFWFDEEGIYSGDEFASVITRAIRNSKIFLFISSVNSNQSKWTSNEISTALEFGKPIIPFRLDGSPYNDSVMMKIVSLDYIEGKDVEKAMGKLLRAIEHHLLSPICQQQKGITSNYDIFICYKRKSLPTANNLYYRLTTRGYSTFFDLEEMGRDNFNTQLLNYIENAKDVFVILEEGSLDACKREDWEKDWFCHEIAFALEKKKNIIPILLNGYTMPSEDFFPGKLKELHFKQAPGFNFSFFDAYLDKLVEKDFLLSKPNLQDKATSVFKFYSDENCQVFKEGKLVCSLEGMSDKPYYLPVPRKGDYRFKAVNSSTSKSQLLDLIIDAIEEKSIEIKWDNNEKKNKRIVINKTKVLSVIFLFLILIILALYIKKGKANSVESQIRDFIELYRDATNNNNISEIGSLYAPIVKRFYNSYNISRDSVICNYKRYESHFKAHNPQSAIQWETLRYSVMKDGFISLSFVEYYSLDREETGRNTMWILEKYFILDKNYQIVKEYEKQLQKGGDL